MNNILVAKSYQGLPTVGEPFISANKKYINVILKSGKTKTVRVYSDAEFAKLYPDIKFTPRTKIVREALGFQKGYITIFRGNIKAPEVEEWCKLAPECRYHTQWGWYVTSNETVPANMPALIAPVRLSWEKVGNSDGTLKAAEVVATAVKSARQEK